MAHHLRIRPLSPPRGWREHLGLGCAPIGDLFTAVTDAAAYDTVGAALSAGITFFDTAPHYGAGVSERRLGDALRGLDRDSVTIATKVGRRIVDAGGGDVAPGAVGQSTVFDLSRDAVLRCVESSLMRLGTDRIDILYLHDPPDVDSSLAEAIPTLLALRDEGVVRAVGVGMNVVEPLLRFVREAPIDLAMIAGRLTLLDRTASAELCPVAAQAGVDIVAAGVFNSGVLADPVPGAHYDYRPVDPEVLARALELKEICERSGVALTSAAVQFPLRYGASGVVVGARSAAEVAAFVASAEGEIPESLWGQLDA